MVFVDFVLSLLLYCVMKPADGSGVLQLRIESFRNPRGLLADGRCCATSNTATCRTQPACRTFFTICLTPHYQLQDNSSVASDAARDSDDECTFGRVTTSLSDDRESFDEAPGDAVNHTTTSSSSSSSSFNFPFDFTWPVSAYFISRNVGT